MALEVNFSEALGRLEVLKAQAPNYAMEAMQKAAANLRRAMISKANSYGTHNWGKTKVNGFTRITFGESEKRAYSRQGDRVSGKNENLAEFIRFQAYDKTKKVLVGFMNEKRGFKTFRYEDGRKTPYTYTSGVHVKEIGERMENGGRIKLTRKQRAMFRYSGMRTIANRGWVKRVARPIVNPTFQAKRGAVISEIKDIYIKLVANSSDGFRRVS